MRTGQSSRQAPQVRSFHEKWYKQMEKNDSHDYCMNSTDNTRFQPGKWCWQKPLHRAMQASSQSVHGKFSLLALGGGSGTMEMQAFMRLQV